MSNRILSILGFSGLFFAITAGAQKPIELLPHQRFPIDYMEKHSEVKGIVINHYMGTGKTYLALGFAERFQDKSVIILAPGFIQSHWMDHLKQLPVKDIKRYQFVSYEDAPKLLKDKDLSSTILITDEVHNLVKFIKSADPEKNKRYSELYENLRSCFKIIALSGTPIYNDEYDLAYLMNLVSGENIMPFNEEQFRIRFTKIKKARSFWRGYVFESNILKQGLPMITMAASTPLIFAYGTVVLPFAAAGAIGSILAFPIVDNWLAPIDAVGLRDLNTDKFQPYVSKYVSFYEIENQDLSEYPSQRVHVEEVGYNAEQFWFFLNFAEKSLGNKGLARLYKDVDANFEHTYLTLNSTNLQTRMTDTVGAGREIGNLDFEGDNAIIDAPKFVRVLNKIRSQGMPKTVVYSNYVENGVTAFARFLDRNGLAGTYEVLRPDLAPDKFAEIVQRYNNNKTKLLLLHPDITEGISLKGTRQFHLLEPVTNLTVQNQVIARTVRYQSHSALPEAERHVDVYIWKAVIGSLSLQTLKLQKANWFKRYSELSDWSNFGQGISQIDKNYDRKKMSPDDQTFLRLQSVNQNMEGLKTIMKAHSIEKPQDASSQESISKLSLAELDESETLELDASLLPKTNLRYFWHFNRELLNSSHKEALGDAFGLNLEIEMPIWKHFASGFYMEGYKGGVAKNPQFDPLDPLGNLTREWKSQYILGFGGFFKPQYNFKGSFGDLGLSLRVPVGFEVVIGPAMVPLFKDQAELDQFILPGFKSVAINTFSGKVGYGFTTGASLGIEYFPIPFAGVVLEGGYQASYQFYPMMVDQLRDAQSPLDAIMHKVYKNSDDPTTSAGFRGYLIHGFSASLGLKLTY